MSMQYLPPYTAFLYCKAGMCGDIPIFLIFAPKHIQNITIFLMTELLFFTAILSGQVP